ncbi:MAG: metalloregulator ArsR/SmtB family transcription factor [Candidatus Bipolaricaulis sp.]|nr:metalloregulator ArsR/SmtB family transcription factor [Candidatus Bipolaricaulis sp.]
MQGAQRVRLSPLYTPEFVMSPTVELLHAMDLVTLADEWGEGFADWVYATRAALADDRYAELAACNAAVSWGRLLARLYPDGRLTASFDDLLRALRGLERKAFTQLAPEPATHEGTPEATRLVATLRRNPVKLKETYVRTVETFLQEHLQARWDEDKTLLREEVEARRGLAWPAPLHAWIETLTGRGIAPEPAFEAAKRLVAVPTRLLGPFVTLSLLETNPTTLLLLYGGGGVSERSGEDRTGSARVAAGFKGLGDETRLRILQLVADREMYAHEIGAHFSHLGQPAVSRHLRYLAGLGLLTTRNAQARTYYSLNRSCVRDLAARLQELASPGRKPSRRRA